MNKSPAFQFYPQDYLASARVAEMTLEEEGVYIRLICYCWGAGNIPADPERCARLAGKGCSVETATTVQRSFNEHPTNPQLLVHDRLERERESQKNRREQASEAGKKSALARAKRAKKPAKTRELNDRSTTVQRNPNTSSSSSSSTSSSNKSVTHPRKIIPPSLESVREYCEERGNTIDPQTFIDWNQSKGWVVGKTKMQDWQAAIRTWEKRQTENGGSNGQSNQRLTTNQQREKNTADSFQWLRDAAAEAEAEAAATQGCLEFDGSASGSPEAR